MTPTEEILAEALAASHRRDEPTRRAVARRIRSILDETPHSPGGPLDSGMRSRLLEVLELLERRS